MDNRSYALIGMPGSGKSTVGRELAAILDKRFIDLDSVIERNACMTIPDMFAEFGEAYFRKRETEALRECVKMHAVISCGGGVIVTEENVKLLKENCFTVYLSAPLDILLKRVGSGAGRPLLAANAKEKLEKQLSERTPKYIAAANAVVKVDNGAPHKIAQNIEQIIKRMENLFPA